MLKATALGLEGLKFRNATATEAGHTGGCERIFLESAAEEQRHMAPANRGAMNAHEADACDVVQEIEELDLRPRRPCSEFVHTMQRRHVRLFSAEIAREFDHGFATIAQSEHQRRLGIDSI